MHELSIAMQIVDSVSSAVADEGDAPITAVNIRVGAMSGVIPEALLFAWDLAVADTRLAGSRLAIEEVPAVVWCPSCEAEFEVDGVRMKCPACGTATPRVVRGRELDILSLELGDDTGESTTNP